MLKRFVLALALSAGLLSPVFAAGTVPGFSLTPQYDLTGHVAFGCKLYVYQAGTTSTPQVAYQDSSLTIPAAGGNVLSCDASGRLPQFFLADGSIKFVLRDVNGVLIFSQDGLLVVGPSGGGGGATPVDPTTVLATGDLKVSYGTGILSGFVRANGRNIGSATSGATERANSDVQALFIYLWGADANLAVGGGRGASAAADWAANKTIALPDWRGRALAGLDDMGNTAAGRLTAAGFGAAGTTLGLAGGGDTRTLATQNLPPYTPAGSVSGSASVTAVNWVASNPGDSNAQAVPGGTAAGVTVVSTGATVTKIASSGSISGTLAGTGQGGTSVPISVIQPTMLATFYIKL
jgi:hypothetical protein